MTLDTDNFDFVHSSRLAQVRVGMTLRALNALLVPMSDVHQCEFPQPRDKRLHFLSGFSGSSGLVVVFESSLLGADAAIWADGRYTVQLAQQTDGRLFQRLHLIDNPAATWIAEKAEAKPGFRLGYDPWLITPAQLRPFQNALVKVGGVLVPCSENLVDEIWTDQPPPAMAPVVPHSLIYAGRAAGEKLHDIAATMRFHGADFLVLTTPASIAWLFNIRGGDVAHTPLPLSFAIVDAQGGATLFLHRAKVTRGLRKHLGSRVRIRPYDAFQSSLAKLGTRHGGKPAKVWVDPYTAVSVIFNTLETAGATIYRAEDPCLLPKACKNAIELNGARNAHLRDGAALARYLCWLQTAVATGRVTEIGAANQLLRYRQEDGLFRDQSFPTISASRGHGAIVHYQPTPETDWEITTGLYLCDSGAQYLDGTTDVTRTVAIGQPTPEMRDRFTRVLKGHIALATAVFASGTCGCDLDGLARKYLLEIGLDYDHGTGHGVGSYLGVHEGPQRITKRPDSVPLREGMIISNEPGFYKEGEYGIRVENLVVVVPAENGMFKFETITMVPIDRNLIDLSLMEPEEIRWVNDYHAQVRKNIAPLVDAHTASWLIEATQPIG